MGKRASSPTGQSKAKTSQAPSSANRATTEHDDEGMGEFEDQWDDEIEQDEEAGEVIDANDKTDDEEEDGEADQEMVEANEDEHNADRAVSSKRAPSPEAYLPGGKLEEGEFLQPDLSTYPLLHSFVPTWPSLSFDILRDDLGEQRRGYPASCSIVSGTQAQDRTANEITVMHWEGLGRTRKDELDSDDEEEDDDDETDDDPILTFKAIPHQGCVNRIRARILPGPLSAGPPAPPAPYHVATFSETGKVHIFDVAPHLDSLLHPGTSSAPLSKLPVYTIDSHGRAEGYALAWGNPIGSSSSARLLSGDIHSKIYLTTMGPASFTPSPKPFASHTDSVEDIQWSPSEPTVFASCSADKSVRVWDIRTKDRRNVTGISDAHESDVNVISWNLTTNYLLASGGDEGRIKVWDLRNLKGKASPAPTPVADFKWHNAPITSIEWHPTEDSCFAASGADDQVTLWDLSVEEDADEKVGARAELKDVPDQLLFVHQGQRDIKEVHWHPQIPGVVISTALDGFNVFKALPFSV
ncbi:BZ3500_MvSof-1268-A1-R1_Chr7-1g09267 [Microbotryum saponariae]|uniref:Glutamate-rich WD repeat-containing protein 1 n=1 Tax=Microbotryum saponariae TaxID=289078 RepID=A0A2X0KXB9_9BASI|nr:BZ3501_MvSof-1269-A2-R1_Chr7-1g08972 [Microbotryum saponariae]SDA03119.1 BZ3500_MvSof-1268-A1-R1_Chr7-1g09267 [Microbotryum saponariae]